MNLKFPWMRDEALAHLDALSNPAISAANNVISSDLDEAVAFLLDDTPTPGEALGLYLSSPDEVVAVSAVAAALESLLARYGTKLSDDEYYSKPEWSDVRVRAQRAATMLRDETGSTS